MSSADAPPDLELLHDVELQMVRVSTAIDELSRDDVDPQAVVSWIPDQAPASAPEDAVDSGASLDVGDRHL